MKLREAIEIEIRIAERMVEDIEKEIDTLTRMENSTGVKTTTMLEGYIDMKNKYEYTSDILKNLLKNED